MRFKPPKQEQILLVVIDWSVSYHRQRSVNHYGDVIMDAIASQITSLTIVYSIVYSDADQRKHQSSASLEFSAQMASNAENVSIWWRHHARLIENKYQMTGLYLCTKYIPGCPELHFWRVCNGGIRSYDRLWKNTSTQLQPSCFGGYGPHFWQQLHTVRFNFLHPNFISLK